MGAFSLQWQNSVVETDLWPTKAKIFSFRRKQHELQELGPTWLLSPNASC